VRLVPLIGLKTEADVHLRRAIQGVHLHRRVARGVDRPHFADDLLHPPDLEVLPQLGVMGHGFVITFPSRPASSSTAMAIDLVDLSKLTDEERFGSILPFDATSTRLARRWSRVSTIAFRTSSLSGRGGDRTDTDQRY
jgi:hypothetical protein